MDNKMTTNSIFNRLNPTKHFTPLSIYSRMITCEEKASLHHQSNLSNPFINFKIELVNNCAKKRKLEDDSYQTPAKKACSPKDLSPDLGCFMDYCSPPARQDPPLSPFAISMPALLDKTQASEMKEMVLHSDNVGCGFSTEPGVNEGTVPHSLRCKNDPLNLAPAFDCDVDDILCLNPFGIDTAVALSDNVDSCVSSSSTAIQNKSVLNPTVALKHELERGDGKGMERGDGLKLEREDGLVEEGREELQKGMYLSVNDVEEDKGYFSMSYIKDLKMGKNPSPSVNLQLPPANSSPLPRIGDIEEPEKESHPKCLSEPGFHEQAALSGRHVSIPVSDLSPIVRGQPPLESDNCPAELLEGDVEEVWNIGSPIFESSIFQPALDGEEASVDTSYENTLPLQVQVKSVVVAVGQHPSSSKTGAPALPVQTAKSVVVAVGQHPSSSKTGAPALPVQTAKSVVVAVGQHPSSSKTGAPALPVQTAKPTKLSPDEKRGSLSAKSVSRDRNQRPVVFDREVDWDREKRLYVHSVARHMNEHQGADKDVMTELMTLMTHVAEQRPGTDGRRWQHPSDLTRRNHQRLHGNQIPKMTLHEWQVKNCAAHKRFAKVPKIFERSPFP